MNARDTSSKLGDGQRKCKEFLISLWFSGEEIPWKERQGQGKTMGGHMINGPRDRHCLSALCIRETKKKSASASS